MKKIMVILFCLISISFGNNLNKKEEFIKNYLPQIQEVYEDLNNEYNYVKFQLEINNLSETELKQYKKLYKAKTNEELLSKMKPHPVSLTLAQARIESNWGTSRFAKEANNLFGIWSFSENDKRLQRGETRDGKAIFVRRYDNYKDSIKHYYKMLSRGTYFKDFQNIKKYSDNSLELSKGLIMYSEKREEYVNMVNKSINENNFKQYDIKYD